MKERLLLIANNEKFNSKEIDLIDEILIQSNGDMRRAVTTLQSLHSLAIGDETSITKETISEIAGIPPSIVMNELWNVLTVSSSSSTSFDTMNRTVQDVCCAGYSAQSILQALLPKIIASNTITTNDDNYNNDKNNNNNLSELSKAKIAIQMAEAEKKMIDGADEYLQLMTVCTLILSCYQQGS